MALIVTVQRPRRQRRAPYHRGATRHERPPLHLTFDDTRAEGPAYHCSPFPDSCARRRARFRRDRFSNVPADPRLIFHRLIFLPSIFLPFPFSPFFVFFRLSQKNHPSVLSVSRKKEKKTKKGASLCSRFFAVLVLDGRGRLHPRRDCFLHGPGRPATIFPHPHFSACHFSANAGAGFQPLFTSPGAPYLGRCPRLV